MKLALALMLSLWATAALAACPSYTIQMTVATADMPAASGAGTDTAGNAWSWSTNDVPSSSAPMSVTLTPASCPAGGPSTKTCATLSAGEADIIAAPNGSLVTPAGTWTWGGQKSGGTDYIMFNGNTSNGWATYMECTNAHLYAKQQGGQWFVFVSAGNNWQAIADPNGF